MKKQIFCFIKKYSITNILCNYQSDRRLEALLGKQLYLDKLSSFPLVIFANDHIGIRINEFGIYEKDD